jgi:CBS domain-containing protein
MTQARDLMTSHVVFVDPDDRVERAIELMLRHRVSGLPVVNSANELLGVITEYDIIDMVDDLETERNQVYHYMSRSPVTIEADTPVSELGKMFRSRSIRRFPVVENGRLVGILSRRELIRFVHAKRAYAQARSEFATATT